MASTKDRVPRETSADDEADQSLLESSRSNFCAQRGEPTLDGSRPLALDNSTLEWRSGDEPRTSGQSFGSASTDLELESMRHEDPLYGNGGADIRNRASWGPPKAGWDDSGRDDDHTMDNADREKEAQRLGTKQFVHKTLINAILIALWYILSISMSVYNKWMFSPGNLDFHFPLFSTSVHMVVQFTLASLILYLFPQFRPSNGTVSPHDPEEPPRQPEPADDASKPLMTPWFYLTRIVSCGTVTGLDIGLGNTSLKFISLTFFTMVKSSTLGFVLGFAILFRLESPSWKIGGIIAVMTLGVILMVSGETAFDGIGFALLMGASFFSGLRWSLTQILLRRTAATSNPFSTLFFLTPVMFVVLFALAIPVETFPALSQGLDTLAQQQGLGVGLLIVVCPGCIAFCMTSAEFALLKRTSVVTLSVCGIFKEVLTITAAGFIFGDELTPINISGLLITILAIAIYNWTRMRKMKRMEISKARDGDPANLNANANSSANVAATERADQSAATGAQTQQHPRMKKNTGVAQGTGFDEQAAMLSSPSPPSKSAIRDHAIHVSKNRSRIRGNPKPQPGPIDAGAGPRDSLDGIGEDVVMIRGVDSDGDGDSDAESESDSGPHLPAKASVLKSRHDGYAAL